MKEPRSKKGGLKEPGKEGELAADTAGGSTRVTHREAGLRKPPAAEYGVNKEARGGLKEPRSKDPVRRGTCIRRRNEP